jgi:hypothetical protein
MAALEMVSLVMAALVMAAPVILKSQGPVIEKMILKSQGTVIEKMFAPLVWRPGRVFFGLPQNSIGVFCFLFPFEPVRPQPLSSQGPCHQAGSHPAH